MAAVRHFDFSKLGILVCDLCLNVILLLHTKFGVDRTINLWDIHKKNDFQYGGRHRVTSGYSIFCF